MRFVAVKSEEAQARTMLLSTRDLLVGQRTQLIDARRGHLAEHGLVAPQGRTQVKRLADALADEEVVFPTTVTDLGRLYPEQIGAVTARITELERRLKASAEQAEATRRLQTMPGVGPITALAVDSFAPAMEDFRLGRDFAARLGFVPGQHSTGGRQRPGRTSKMGQRDIRSLLITGAMAVVRSAVRKGAREGSWLARMLARKPRKLVAIALADKIARGLRAMITKHQDYRDPAAATA